MGLKKTSKEKILKSSIKLFKKDGYYNTSMASIASELGIIKGSIYHHFKSKEEIGIEALKYIHNYFNDNIFNLAYQNNISSKEKIVLFVKKTDEYFLNSQGGCLLGNLALEVSSENEIFRKEIKEYFISWENALINILIEKFPKEKAKEMSKEYVALTQGEIMMMNLYNSSEKLSKSWEKNNCSF